MRDVLGHVPPRIRLDGERTAIRPLETGDATVHPFRVDLVPLHADPRWAVLVAKGSEIAVTDLPESIREESTTATDFVIPPHRTLAEIEKSARGYEATVQAKTGLMLDPYFSASKIAWAMRESTMASSSASSAHWTCSGIFTPATAR